MTPEELKAGILASDDLTVEPVATPEWAKAPEVCVRGLTGDELAGLGTLDDKTHEMRVVVARGLCTPEGVSLGFSETEVEVLGGKSVGPLRRCYDTIMRLSGLDEEAVEAVGKDSPGTDDAATG